MKSNRKKKFNVNDFTRVNSCYCWRISCCYEKTTSFSTQMNLMTSVLFLRHVYTSRLRMRFLIALRFPHCVAFTILTLDHLHPWKQTFYMYFENAMQCGKCMGKRMWQLGFRVVECAIFTWHKQRHTTEVYLTINYLIFTFSLESLYASAVVVYGPFLRGLSYHQFKWYLRHNKTRLGFRKWDRHSFDQDSNWSVYELKKRSFS